jgi:hypothetical protein
MTSGVRQHKQLSNNSRAVFSKRRGSPEPRKVQQKHSLKIGKENVAILRGPVLGRQDQIGVEPRPVLL